MTFQEYYHFSERIATNAYHEKPYEDKEYLHYATMNFTRMKRWLSTYEVTEELASALNTITQPQHWILITEPWCGDAAHIVPVIHLLSLLNQHITLEIQLRDQEPFLIDKYLTNGGKSIPILVIRNEDGSDKATWGPRPEGAKALFASKKAANADFDDLKTALQQWYNKDKGKEIGSEIISLATQ